MHSPQSEIDAFDNYPIRMKYTAAFYLGCTLLASSSTLLAQEYVEITIELNIVWESSNRTNTYLKTATCVVNTNDWWISSGDIQTDTYSDYWLIGTNIVEHKLNTSSRLLQRAKDLFSEKIFNKPSIRRYPWKGETFTCIRPWQEPFGSGVARVYWLALCSGSFLVSEGRKVPMPLGFRLKATGYSDKTTIFAEDFGLPKELQLYATNGQLVCEYEVHTSTNFLGRTFPLEFRLVQYGAPNNGGAISGRSKSIHLGKVTAMKIGTRPVLPEEVRKEIEK